MFGSKAVGEPPLMLAISVREAIRDAVAAFGTGGPVRLAGPATPERVFFAVRRARKRASGLGRTRSAASMSSSGRGELLRAPLFHTPRNPFRDDKGLESLCGRRVADSRRQESLLAATTVRSRRSSGRPDHRSARRISAAGLHRHAHSLSPAARARRAGTVVARLAGVCRASRRSAHVRPRLRLQTARAFVDALASHGTTTALVFGAHFAAATASLFEAAGKSGLRIVSGLVLSDRRLRPELHQTPEDAYRECTDLIRRFHGKGRLLYAVTPRFALSTSEAMLEVCQTLLREHPGVRFQTHINENRQEIAEVAQLFPWASDYLSVYERFELGGRGAVMAHNVHPTDSELERLAASGTAIAHCPCSNAALGSGLFPLRRHIAAGVTCALGTDVGGGTGFGMLKEGLQAYLLQRLAPDGVLLSPGHLLYLATRAGAEALALDEEIGDFSRRESRRLRVLAAAGRQSARGGDRAGRSDADRILAALFTLGGAESVREVRVEGAVVYRSASMTIEDLNSLDRAQFVEAVGWVFEHSPWVAERAWAARPFANVDALHGAMVDKWKSASANEQLALLRAHPDLGTRARVSEASAAEQAGAGLDRLTPEEFERLLALNEAYRDKFGFPFLFAVKGSTQARYSECARTTSVGFARRGVPGGAHAGLPDREIPARKYFELGVDGGAICQRLEAKLLRQGRRDRLPSESRRRDGG